MTPRELEDRLINFAVNIIRLSEGIKPNIAGNNLSGQIVRSSSSVALNYGEAQSAESPKDFVHNELISIFVKSIETSKRKQGTLSPKINP